MVFRQMGSLFYGPHLDKCQFMAIYLHILHILREREREREREILSEKRSCPKKVLVSKKILSLERTCSYKDLNPRKTCSYKDLVPKKILSLERYCLLIELFSLEITMTGCQMTSLIKSRLVRQSLARWKLPKLPRVSSQHILWLTPHIQFLMRPASFQTH